MSVERHKNPPGFWDWVSRISTLGTLLGVGGMVSITSAVIAGIADVGLQIVVPLSIAGGVVLLPLSVGLTVHLFQLKKYTARPNEDRPDDQLREVLTPTKLAEEAGALSEEIREFIAERARAEPILGPGDRSSGEKHQRFSQITMSLYIERFSGRVVRLNAGLQRLGIENKELSRSGSHPTNPIGIRMVADALDEVSVKHSSHLH